ncbi:MAG: RNA polymerase sigma-70 factor [Bacteroidales bacterium]
MSNTPDHILLKKIIEGNKMAFDHLFFKYYKPLFRFAYNFCQSSVIAEESVQNTFIKIWNHNHTLSNCNNIGKLLFAYTRNEIIDEIRKNNTRRKYESAIIPEMFINEKKDMDENYKVKAIIESAIDQLPKKAKKIFRMAKQEGLSIKEISQHLNISSKTVENQLTIAYKKMRVYLEPFKDELKF